jgi:hypothetical protein
MSESDTRADYRRYNISQYELYDSSFRHLPGLDPASPLPPPLGLEGAAQARIKAILRNLGRQALGIGIEIDETDQSPPPEGLLDLDEYLTDV